MPGASVTPDSSCKADGPPAPWGFVSPWVISGAFFVLAALALLPILSVEIPPLFDYPNHMARMGILAARGQDPLFNRFYAIRWTPLPNLAMDLIVPWMSRLIPLMLAGRLFVACTLLLFAAGILALHRAAWGRWHWWPLLGFLLLYNRILLWGFLNYLAGLGIAFVAAAGWLALAHRPLRRVAVTAPLALAVFFSHMAAFGVLVLIMIGIDLPVMLRAWREARPRVIASRALALLICLALPCAIFLTWRNHADAVIRYGSLGRKVDLLFSVFDNYHRPFDVAAFVVFAGALLAAAITRHLAFDPRLRWATGLMVLAYCLAPDDLMTANGLDHRLPLACFGLLIASTTPSRLDRRIHCLVAAAACLLFIVRMGLIEQTWLKSRALYAQDLRVLSVVPPGTRLALVAPSGAVNSTAIPEYHLPTLAILASHAFVPTLFAYGAQQPVAFTSAFAPLAAASSPPLFWQALVEGDDARLRAARDLLRRFDMILFIGQGTRGRTTAACLAPVSDGGNFRLYRIAHDTSDCP